MNDQEKKLKISVITAVFNREKFIERAILSIKEQDYKNIELIIIDGGSTDGTLDILKCLINEEDVLISEKDCGIYDALNKGIKKASGDIICFLHSDDLFENSNVLFRINELFIKNQVDIVYGNVTFFKINSEHNIFREYVSPIFSKKNLSYGLMPAHPAMFIKKIIFEKHGHFNIMYKIAGDFDWLCRVVSDNSLKYLKVNDNFIKMQYGGASTNGLKSLLLLNKEVMLSLRVNNIKSSYFKLFFKYLKKISEFKLLQ
jgi:glycosyltransferase involved in cell wall biosynthesis